MEVHCDTGMLPVTSQQLTLEAAPKAGSEEELTFHLYATQASDPTVPHMCSGRSPCKHIATPPLLCASS